MHKSVQNNAIKLEEVCYAALEGASKISFYGVIATAQEFDGPFVSAIETAPEGKLKLYLKIHLAIYIKTHKKVDLGLHLRLHLRVHLRLHFS